MIGKMRVLNLFSDFQILPLLDTSLEGINKLVTEIDREKVPIVLEVGVAEKEYKTVNPEKFGKKPLILVTAGSSPIAVIDEEYRIWLHRDTFNDLNEEEIAEIVEAFWEAMSNEEFVKKVIEEKARMYSVSVAERNIKRLSRSVAGYFKTTKDSVLEVLKKFKEVSRELDEFLNSDYLTVATTENENRDNRSATQEDGREQRESKDGGSDGEVAEGDVITFDDLIRGL